MKEGPNGNVDYVMVECGLHPQERLVARNHYEALRAQVKQAQDDGRLSKTLSREEMIDWAYGNVAIHNPAVTREMVAAAYDRGENR